MCLLGIATPARFFIKQRALFAMCIFSTAISDQKLCYCYWLVYYRKLSFWVGWPHRLIFLCHFNMIYVVKQQLCKTLSRSLVISKWAQRWNLKDNGSRSLIHAARRYLFSKKSLCLQKKTYSLDSGFCHILVPVFATILITWWRVHTIHKSSSWVVKIT